MSKRKRSDEGENRLEEGVPQNLSYSRSPEFGPVQATESECPVCLDTKLLSKMYVVCANDHSFCVDCIERLRQSAEFCPICRERMGASSIYRQSTVRRQHCVYPEMKSADRTHTVLCPFSPSFIDDKVNWPYAQRRSALDSLRYEREIDLSQVLSYANVDAEETEFLSRRNGTCEAMVLVKKGTLDPVVMTDEGQYRANVVFKTDGVYGVVMLAMYFDGEYKFLPPGQEDSGLCIDEPNLVHFAHGLRTVMDIFDLPSDYVRDAEAQKN